MDFTQFECQRCTRCCEQPGDVTLLRGEEEAIATYLKMALYSFVNHYCDMPVTPRLILKKKANDHCIFLTQLGCSIYPARPAQCHDFPIKWRTPASWNYCEGLKKL